MALARGGRLAREVQLDPGRGLLTPTLQPPQGPQVCCIPCANVATQHQETGPHASHAVPIPCPGLCACHMQLCPCAPAAAATQQHEIWKYCKCIRRAHVVQTLKVQQSWPQSADENPMQATCRRCALVPKHHLMTGSLASMQPLSNVAKLECSDNSE